MISKELLSEILGEKVEDIIYHSFEMYRMDLSTWCYKSAGYTSNAVINVTIQGNTYDVNIYELAHKLKMWAKDKDYILESGLKSCLATLNSADYEYEEWFNADTEPEAIIKACEWILKEIKFKQLKEEVDEIYRDKCLSNMEKVLREEFSINGN